MISKLQYFPYVLLCIVLCIIAVQDIKKRQIHILLLIFAFGASLLINYLDENLVFKVIVTNTAFVIINIAVLFIYYSIKTKAYFNPINQKIGLGDILFFFVITPLFFLKSFILFFIISLMGALILHWVFTKTHKESTIPLAGYMSICLLVFMLVSKVLDVKILQTQC